MPKPGFATALCLVLLSTFAYADNDFSTESALWPVELKWLRAGEPVLKYAAQQQLPVDVVVQPTVETSTPPLSASVAEGRCKLVLSMRGNGDVETILADLPAELHAIAIEAMTAHELAHCWRYLNGMWHTLPAGFIDSEDAEPGNDRAILRSNMRNTRREEGFADLVGLAWTLRAHPQHYTAIHAWFEQVRTEQPVAGGFHDTRIWLQLVPRAEAFPQAITPFEQARRVWSRGLMQQ